jgi:hypothetical protein
MRISVLLVLLISLALSAINHAYAGLKAEHRSMRTFTRPLGTALLIAVSIPFIIRALNTRGTATTYPNRHGSLDAP